MAELCEGIGQFYQYRNPQRLLIDQGSCYGVFPGVLGTEYLTYLLR